MTRTIHAARGAERTAKSWGAEAAKRMLMNNLDPEVAEHPEDLVVYGGTGRAARSWESYDAIVRTLDELEPDETLLVQSGKPVGVFRTHEWAPRVLIANSNLVGDWANWPEFRRLESLGLTMYGQMTTPSFIVTASGCAPPIPPRPAVTVSVPASVPPNRRSATAAKVRWVPWRMPWVPM